MLDQTQQPLERNELPSPPQSEQMLPALRQLLAPFPLSSCDLVVSLPRDYHIKALRLPELSLQAVRLEAETYLPYPVSEADFSYHPIGPNKAVVVACPQKTLHWLRHLIGHLEIGSSAFEASEMAQLRDLERPGEPVALLDFQDDWIHFSALAGSEYFALSQGVSQQSPAAQSIERFLRAWTELRRPRPQYVMSNAPCDWVSQLTQIEARPLPPQYLALGLAQSQPGPQRYERAAS